MQMIIHQQQTNKQMNKKRKTILVNHFYYFHQKKKKINLSSWKKKVFWVQFYLIKLILKGEEKLQDLREKLS